MLTKDQIEIILTSLSYAQRKAEEYTQYPSYEYKQAQIKSIQDLIADIKLRGLKWGNNNV